VVELGGDGGGVVVCEVTLDAGGGLTAVLDEDGLLGGAETLDEDEMAV
jgi:hypothetical protein